MARLDQICKLNMGQSPDSTSYNENGIGIPFFQGNADFGALHPTVRIWCSEPTKVANPGDILISVRAPIGALNIANVKCCIGRGLAALTVDENKCTKEYLWHVIRSKVPELNSKGTGSTFKAISKNTLAETEIPLPSLYKQRHIASSMDKCDQLITLRKQQLAKLDELVKARFVELFGDPVINPKGWDMPLIEEVVANEKNALKAGPFGSALKKEYYVSSGYKIYGQEQVISGDHTFGDYYIDEERYKSLENCAVQAGDVLISLVGTYGKLLVMPEEFEPGIINPRLMKITFDKKRVNPYYFQHYFQSDSLKKALAENTHGGTMDILNLGIVRKLAMPLPPLELQNEFITFVEQTDKSKLAIQQSLDKLETLKKSLMQKYFG